MPKIELNNIELYYEEYGHGDDVVNRISIINLTAKGKALIPLFMEISERLKEKAFQNISGQEKEILHILLTKLNNSM